MVKIICPNCKKVHETDGNHCPVCEVEKHVGSYNFQNSDDYLNEQVPKIKEERKISGLEGLVGGLEALIINTELDRQETAVKELLNTTGFEVIEGFEDQNKITWILGGVPNSADLIITSRKIGANPFTESNKGLKTSSLPNTRLETFVFSTPNIEKYMKIQKSRGIDFIADIEHNETHSFVQTSPSKLTGNSIGLIQRNDSQSYAPDTSEQLTWHHPKPDKPYLKNIGRLDHTASRVRAKDRDAAIIEFMNLTNYNFEMAIYVKSLNSITNVSRLGPTDFAMVFTSGISPFTESANSGPTEQFIQNKNTRVHHLALDTQEIENTFAQLKENGLQFLLDLIGSPEEGLKQTFSAEYASTFLVNEYIYRYGDFDGFFTKDNVTMLTQATELQ